MTGQAGRRVAGLRRAGWGRKRHHCHFGGLGEVWFGVRVSVWAGAVKFGALGASGRGDETMGWGSRFGGCGGGDKGWR